MHPSLKLKFVASLSICLAETTWALYELFLGSSLPLRRGAAPMPDIWARRPLQRLLRGSGTTRICYPCSQTRNPIGALISKFQGATQAVRVMALTIVVSLSPTHCIPLQLGCRHLGNQTHADGLQPKRKNRFQKSTE